MNKITLLLASTAALSASPIQDRIVEMLKNFQQNGINSDNTGLWIHWHYGSHPHWVTAEAMGIAMLALFSIDRDRSLVGRSIRRRREFCRRCRVTSGSSAPCASAPTA